MLQPFLASLAYLDTLTPFRVQDLVSAYPSARVGVEDAIDHIPTSSLFIRVSLVLRMYDRLETHPVQRLNRRIALLTFPSSDIIVIKFIVVLLRKPP